MTEIKRHPIVVMVSCFSITKDQIQSNDCKGREFVKGNGFKQVVESSILNKNLSLILVYEHHTVETCQNIPTFILQIWQKSEASLCLAFLPLFLPGFFGVSLIKFKVNIVAFLQFSLCSFLLFVYLTKHDCLRKAGRSTHL